MPTRQQLDAAFLDANHLVPAILRLGGGTVVMSAPGVPRSAVGTNAAVFQVRQGIRGLVAVRCLFDDAMADAVIERYRAIVSAPILKPLRAGTAPVLAGTVSVWPDGLTVGQEDHRTHGVPVVAMEWVAGDTLTEAVEKAVRAHDADRLAALAEAWTVALARLADAGVTHADLAPANAIVRPDGNITFVDYDTLTWSGGPAPLWPTVSSWHDHPSGKKPSDPRRADAFAGLLVGVSLRILAHQPELWLSAPGVPHDRPLLIDGRELRSPAAAAALRDATRGDAELRGLVDMLIRAASGFPEDVAHLSETLMRQPVRAPAPAKPAPPTAPAFQRERSRATEARPVSAEVRMRQEKLTHLNGLLITGDDDAALLYWQTSGLSLDPEAIGELGAHMAMIAARVEFRLMPQQPRPQRPQPSNRPGPMPKYTIQNAPPPLEFPVAPSVRPGRTPEGEQLWRQSLPTTRPARPERPAPDPRPERSPVERLRLAIRQNDSETVAALWPRLRLDPAAGEFAVAANAIIARMRLSALDAAIDRKDDHAILAAATEAERSGVPLSTTQRIALRAVRTRMATAAAFDKALNADDRDTLATLALSGALDTLPALDRDAIRDVNRALTMPAIEAAISTDDDDAIAAACVDLDADLLAFLPDSIRARIHLAADRLSWIDSIRLALRDRDATTVALLLPIPPAGADERLSETERRRLNRLLDVARLTDQLNVALVAGDDVALLDVVDAYEAAGEPLPGDFDSGSVRGHLEWIALVAAVRRAAVATPPDYDRLGMLLPQVRDQMDGHAFPDLDVNHLERLIAQESQRRRIREALVGGDDWTIITTALPDLLGVIPTLIPGEQSRIDLAQLAVRHRHD